MPATLVEPAEGHCLGVFVGQPEDVRGFVGIEAADELVDLRLGHVLDDGPLNGLWEPEEHLLLPGS